MSEGTGKVEKKKSDYRFDLSDGFTFSDIGGIMVGIWKAIKKLFIIILYPYVWLYRMLTRSYRFFRVPAGPGDRLLLAEERKFVEALPAFFIMFGLFTAVAAGVIVVFGYTELVNTLINGFNLQLVLDVIAWWLAFILEVSLWIIGLDTYENGEKIERFGIIDIIRESFTLMFNIFLKDAVLTFIGITVIGFVLVVALLLVSETRIITMVIDAAKKVYDFITSTPQRIYDSLNSLFMGINSTISAIIIGGVRLEGRTVAYFRKVVVVALALGIYTFLGGIFVVATHPVDLSTTNGKMDLALFFMFVLITFGLGVGIVEMAIITRVLDIVSRGKYTVAGEAAGEKTKQEDKKPPRTAKIEKK
ncbi:MAG: hypothetical protein ACFFD4_28355 [Candidatus Odinarchaeota archaeon]